MTTCLLDHPRKTDGPWLYALGWRTGLAHSVDHIFVRPAAMFIFRGTGRLMHRGAQYDVTAPAVFLAQPGRRYQYGPNETWDEFNAVFTENSPDLQLADWPEEPWRMGKVAVMEAYRSRAARLMENPAAPGVADQLDALVRLMLLTSRFGSGQEVKQEPLRRIYAAEQWMQMHLAEHFNLKDLAERFAFSPSTFRRWWSRVFDTPPWQYVLNLRMREAQRLLLDLPYMPVQRVARRVGYPDQRYFATVFKERTGRSPTEYRRAHRG